MQPYNPHKTKKLLKGYYKGEVAQKPSWFGSDAPKKKLFNFPIYLHIFGIANKKV